MFKNLATGEIMKGYKHHEPLAEKKLENSVGEVLYGVVTNNFDHLSPRIANSLAVGSDSSGGYLLEPILSSEVLDLARSASVAMRAGATTLPIQGETHLATLETDPTAYWRRELEAVTASRPAFGKIRLVPKMVSCLVPISLELLEDANNASSVIENAITSMLAQEIDSAILTGTGASGEPLGVTNHGSVNTIAAVGTPTTYAHLRQAVGDVLVANYDGDLNRLAWIMNPAVGEVYDGLVTGISNDNTPLTKSPWVEALRPFMTTTLAASSDSPNQYTMIVGDMSQVTVGMRTSGIRVEVLNEGTVTDASSVDFNATTQFLRHIRAYARLDVAIMRPTWLTVLSGVTL
jgi:HK97 family phage major capsid protein